uniref:glycosyltransferase family 4 protein n=1 Tax=uncultured Varibaculum sp. TaxID=413896 RepID=UPI00259A6F99
FLQAIEQIPADSQVVLCAGAPDTPEIEKEVRELVAGLSARRSGIIWIEEMLPHDQLVNILSAAHVFVTPSIYEPMGIVNLEAAAMELPVVGTATGGIPDCIAEGETGYLVPIEQLTDGSGTPTNPDKFHRDMAERITALLENPELAKKMGKAGRKRVEEKFSWQTVADKTVELYRSLL